MAQCAASLWVEGTQSLESARQEDQTSAGHRLLQTQSDNCGQIASNADELDKQSDNCGNIASIADEFDKHKVTTMERDQMLMSFISNADELDKHKVTSVEGYHQMLMSLIITK